MQKKRFINTLYLDWNAHSGKVNLGKQRKITVALGMVISSTLMALMTIMMVVLMMVNINMIIVVMMMTKKTLIMISITTVITLIS